MYVIDKISIIFHFIKKFTSIVMIDKNKFKSILFVIIL